MEEESVEPTRVVTEFDLGYMKGLYECNVSRSEIARRVHHSRNTVAKYIENDF
jgi:hypothetical protein